MQGYLKEKCLKCKIENVMYISKSNYSVKTFISLCTRFFLNLQAIYKINGKNGILLH